MSSEDISSYKQAIVENREIDCILGIDVKYRFTNKYSYFVSITDTQILWTHCLIPIYREGDVDIPNRVMSMINELLDRKDTLSVYQAVSLMADYVSLTYSEKSIPPFVLDFSCFQDKLLQIIQENKNEYMSYQGKELASCHDTPYDLITRLLRNYKILDIT